MRAEKMILPMGGDRSLYEKVMRALYETGYIKEHRAITGRDHAHSITNDMPEAGGGGASAGVTDGPDVAASDDDDGGDGDGEDDCQRPRPKHKQPSPGPAPLKRGNARTGTRNAATKPPQSVDPLLLKLPAVLSTFPVSRSAWFQGVRDGRYPKPVRLGARAVAWRASDIRSLVDSLAVGQ